MPVGEEELAGLLRLPPGRPRAGVVHAVGWMSLKEAAHYRGYHAALTERGIAVLAFDYRGLGGSTGDPSRIHVDEQVDDAAAATMWLGRHLAGPPVGIFGTGATGAGVAIAAAAETGQIGSVAAVQPISDGSTWLAGMRSATEWARLRQRAADDPDGRVRPIGDVLIPPPERSEVGFKRDLGSGLPPTIAISSVSRLAAFRPIDHVARLAPRPLLIIAVADDPLVGVTHANALMEAAGEPKTMQLLHGTTAYRLHATHGAEIARSIADWFESTLGLRHDMAGAAVEARRQ